MIKRLMIMGVIVDIHRHRPQGRDFAGEGAEECIVLPVFFVGYLVSFQNLLDVCVCVCRRRKTYCSRS